ncbi:MAG: cyclic nucleotide-binding domain-containing protein [Alphaproteobacteria bacterium]|nr:cyclic nucleotide-binding domain-containing protein [Alphaproteobacteria bacterium]
MSNNKTIYDRVSIAAGEMFISEGQEQSQAYLIQSGSVGVFTYRADKKIKLATLEAGEIIGEMALITGGVRSANVEALEDCILIRISRQEFEDRLSKSDQAIQTVVKMLCKRVIMINESLISKLSSLDDLQDAAEEVYEETKAEVPNIDDERLLPKLKQLLKAVEDFKEKYVQESMEQGYSVKRDDL